MVVQNQSQLGKGSAILTDPHHVPTIIQSLTQPQKIQKPWKPKRKDIQVPQPSDPIKNVCYGGFSFIRRFGDVCDKDRLKLDELMAICTTLQNKVLDLEKTKISQHNEIASLKRRVKKLEKKSWSRTHKLKRLYKVGSTARVGSSDNEESLGEDASKQGRIDVVDANKEITLVSVQNVDEEMFDVNVLDAQALIEMKSTKPKVKGVVIQDLGESTITKCTPTISLQQSQDKGKGILIEPMEPMKKKDLIRLDKEVALKLHVEFDEEERLSREKAEKEKEANIALIEIWDDIQAKIDVDYQLAERLQAQEQEKFSIEEKATLFQQLLKKEESILQLKEQKRKETNCRN
ncbi:hypothetical protein Tco_0772298 [Tanacetum coccineum]|uniref:Uncharacterized protein n=1 Tax=Tanacetum coccineum TaxID=301880 RepID=A0ABQ4ZKG1_9ASTR